MRDMLRHYFNIGSKTTPKWILLGEGITGMKEDFNPQSETKQYINHRVGTTKIKSYTPSLPVEREYMSDELQKWIDERVKTLPVGEEAVSEYVRINLMEKADASGNYPAVRQRCTYQFDSSGGDAGSEQVDSMTLSGAGDREVGFFNVKEGEEVWVAAPAESGQTTQSTGTGK